MTDEHIRDEFLEAYERLAALGQCDATGSEEYKRVRMEWDLTIDQPRGATLEMFIRSKVRRR